MKNIRNFSIISHIDHGKSTLADCLIHICKGLEDRYISNKILDSMEIERERGITIKSQAAILKHKHIDGSIYTLNLIDTPGHSDFSNEVNRSLSACEGAILLIDASQGIKAQTVANSYSAIKFGIKLITIINKIDLRNINIRKILKEIDKFIGIDIKNTIFVSAKNYFNIKKILEYIVNYIPKVDGNVNSKLKAIIFDSWFNNYIGIVMLIRIIDGKIETKDKILFMYSKKTYICKKIGVFTPKSELSYYLISGTVGFITANIKNIKKYKVGDTITSFQNPIFKIISNLEKLQSKIFSSIYPIKNNKYEDLIKSIKKLQINDSSLFFEKESSNSLGLGLRCGFLGFLHMEIVKERLEREFNIRTFLTHPSVSYKIILLNNREILINKPSDMPDNKKIFKILEPIVTLFIFTPKKYLNDIINFCRNKRCKEIGIDHQEIQVKLKCKIPFSEIISEFFNIIKSISSGYASISYNFLEYSYSKIIKVDIFINYQKIEDLSYLIHETLHKKYIKNILLKIKNIIPRQMFNISIQAKVGGKIIFSEKIKAIRKNVLSKCYGGDVSRKLKLLKKQKIGKKKADKMCKLKITSNIFRSILMKK